jgi:hypothetical protein
VPGNTVDGVDVMHFIALHDQAAAGWIRSLADLQFHDSKASIRWAGQSVKNVGDPCLRIDIVHLGADEHAVEIGSALSAELQNSKGWNMSAPLPFLVCDLLTRNADGEGQAHHLQGQA